MEKKSTSWGWIVFWFIIFWPVGLYLMIKKLATDKSALMSKKTNLVPVFGWILTVLGILGLFTEFEQPEVFGIALSLMFLAGGILLLRKASEAKKAAIKYRKYINMVVNQNVRSLDSIASAVSLPLGDVTKDLQDMIDIGFLKDAYIDHGNREICLKQSGNPANVSTNAAAQTKVIRCLGCGANNVVTIAATSECEYCGTPINA